MWKYIEVQLILEGIEKCSPERTADHSIEVDRSSALLNNYYSIEIAMARKNDKTNIGLARRGTATKVVSRQSYTAIFPKYQSLFCADHDFSTIEKFRQLSMRILIHQNISLTNCTLEKMGGA